MMRNNYEDLDERIDRWRKESKRHNYSDYYIGPIGFISGVDDIDMFRGFDPDTSTVLFWGQSFNIKEILDEVTRILPLVEIEASKSHWGSP
jgi:hypothetical protein